MEERIYKPGELIGHYQVLGHLGTGGFCCVYEVKDLTDAESAGTSALKITRWDPKTLSVGQRWTHNRRLRREFELIHKLNHHNIVTTLEGRFHDGIAWYVMELLEGPTFGRFLAEERRPLRTVLDIYQQLTEGIAYCHREGIVHRDLKPSNIIITPQTRQHPSQALPAAEQGYFLQDEPDPSLVSELPSDVLRSHFMPVIYDFGLARSLAATVLISPGHFVGTVEYLSPDYCRAISRRRLRFPYLPQPSDDIHALAVILYELLTGQLPWQTPTHRNDELIAEIAERKPAHPGELNPGVPPALAELAMLGLSKDGRKRPADAGDLLWRVNAALQDDAAFLDGFPPPYRGEQETRISRERIETTFNRTVASAERTTESAGTAMSYEVSRTPRSRLGQLPIPKLANVALILLLLVGVILPHAQKTPPLTQLALSGLKMPEKPEPNWLRPGPDGECHDPKTGEKLAAAVLRGACWQIFPKADPNRPCLLGTANIQGSIYDAPPEAPAELKNSCFLPYQIKRTPQSVVPGSK